MATETEIARKRELTAQNKKKWDAKKPAEKGKPSDGAGEKARRKELADRNQKRGQAEFKKKAETASNG